MMKLHVGAGNHLLPGWVNTDMSPCSGEVLGMDATQRFPFEDDSFDYVFSEHMIEHVPLEGGRSMLAECLRVLKPGGRVRISCPDLAFITRLVGPDEGLLDRDREYVTWAAGEFNLHDALRPAVSVGVNLAIGFGHRHIYSKDGLRAELERAGFAEVDDDVVIGMSAHAEFRELENAARMPPGFLQLETMTLEAVKPPA